MVSRNADFQAADSPSEARRTSSRQLHVLHTTFGLNVGGQEKLLVELARHSDRRCFALTFVSLGGRGELAGELESCGANVIAMGEPSGLKLGLIYRMGRLFRRLRPDVVHTHDHRSLFYAGPAAWLTRVPLLINTRHGKNCHSTPRQVVVGSYLARLVDRYICVSDDVKAQCIAEGIPASRLLTIKNGIDVVRFAFSGPRPGGPIVALARLSPEKDLANLVRATALAAEQVRDLQVEIGGGGPLLEELTQLAVDLGMGERIRFLGDVRDVPALLSRARMFVLPSRSEGIPLTVLEAMACGLPVVATRVGGLSEVVDQGVTGMLVPAADSGALSEAMVAIWNDADRGDQMGRAGRQRALRCFDVRRMVAEYEALHHEKVKRKQRTEVRPVTAAPMSEPLGTRAAVE
jgi:glycosyltransferase involved in cell wall biosynthesis